MALRDLSKLAGEIQERYRQYHKDEFILPADFVSSVKSINGSPIRYYTHTAIIQKNSAQVIILPNQWFAIASFLTEYKKELLNYKLKAKQFFSDTQIKSLRDRPMTSEEFKRIRGNSDEKKMLKQFLTDYPWWYGGKTADRTDFSDSPILNIAGVINDSQAFITDLVDFFIDQPQYILMIQDAAISQSQTAAIVRPEGISYNQIYYGAPGTGKSKVIRNITEGASNTRTTFHPDTDYAAFVGAYKPSKDEHGNIIYDFVPQAFTNAYVNAWKNLHTPYYLVIEEINRGNCAQVFGDIFQLLDRREDGFSEYTTDVDTDLASYLKMKLSGTPEYLRKISEICGSVAGYSKIALPGNLYILATMNTSDQSLYPMDSAFKRRWSWEYVPINYADAENLLIEIDGMKYNWAKFLRIINPKIKELTESEDKQLGNRFVNPHDGIITFEHFRSKVMFYLWFEVCKEGYGTTDNFFRTSDEEEFSFGELFGNSDSEDKQKIKSFFAHIGLEPEVEKAGEVNP